VDGVGPRADDVLQRRLPPDTLRTKHPWALGRPAREVWAEIWDDIGPRIASVLETGEATWDEALLLVLERAGYVEETYHTFSYSPLADGSGAVVGMLCVVSEDTERVIGERRLRILSELGDVSAVTAPTTPEACRAAVEVLSRGRVDVPFSAVYLLEDGGRRARLAARHGLRDDPRIAEVLDRDTDPDGPLWDVLHTGAPLDVEGLATTHAGAFLPHGPGRGADPDRAVVVPLTGGGGDAVGAVVAGVSPLRALDEEYRRFLDLVGVGIGTAVADARAYQAQRARADELAELDRAKTEFFTGVSHELRTPLTLIAGPAEDALADAGSPLPPAQRERVELIARNSGRLRRLVDALLEFSRLENGRTAPDRVAVDLAALTRGVVESFAPAITRAGLGLVVHCPALPAVSVDPEMWEKIVLNLLSNAVKYTLQGEVRVALHRDRDGVRLTVTDTGIGVPDGRPPAAVPALPPGGRGGGAQPRGVRDRARPRRGARGAARRRRGGGPRAGRRLGVHRDPPRRRARDRRGARGHRPDAHHAALPGRGAAVERAGPAPGRPAGGRGRRHRRRHGARRRGQRRPAPLPRRPAGAALPRRGRRRRPHGAAAGAHAAPRPRALRRDDARPRRVRAARGAAGAPGHGDDPGRAAVGPRRRGGRHRGPGRRRRRLPGQAVLLADLLARVRSNLQLARVRNQESAWRAA
jgi:signal transduction histidine kinase